MVHLRFAMLALGLSACAGHTHDGSSLSHVETSGTAMAEPPRSGVRVAFECASATREQPATRFDPDVDGNAPQAFERVTAHVAIGSCREAHDLGRYQGMCLSDGVGEMTGPALAVVGVYLSDEGGDYGYALRIVESAGRLRVERTHHNDGRIGEWELLLESACSAR